MYRPELGIILTSDDAVCVANAHIFLPAVFDRCLNNSSGAFEINCRNANTKDINTFRIARSIKNQILTAVCWLLSHDLRFRDLNCHQNML